MSKFIDYIEGREEFFEESFLYELFTEKIEVSEEPTYIEICKMPFTSMVKKESCDFEIYDYSNITVLKDDKNHNTNCLFLIDKINKIIVVNKFAVELSVGNSNYFYKIKDILSKDLLLSSLGEYKITILEHITNEVRLIVNEVEKKLTNENMDKLCVFGEKFARQRGISEEDIINKMRAEYVLGIPLTREVETSYITTNNHGYDKFMHFASSEFLGFHVEYLRDRNKLIKEIEDIYYNSLDNKDNVEECLRRNYDIDLFLSKIKKELHSKYADEIYDDDNIKNTKKYS